MTRTEPRNWNRIIGFSAIWTMAGLIALHYTLAIFYGFTLTDLIAAIPYMIGLT